MFPSTSGLSFVGSSFTMKRKLGGQVVISVRFKIAQMLGGRFAGYWVAVAAV